MRFAHPRARAKLTFARLEIPMKPLVAIAAACAALSLASCGTTRELFRVNPKVDAEVQKTQAEANAAFTKAMADRLRYCTITGFVDLTLKVAADAGMTNSASLNCPGKPWETQPTFPVN